MKKRIFSLFLVMVFIVSFACVSASAKEVDNSILKNVENGISDDDPGSGAKPGGDIGVGPTNWVTVYTGDGSAVNLTLTNTTGLYFCIKMIDYSGTEVWYQYHSLGPWESNQYYVGSNVKYVKLIGSDGIGAGVIHVSVSPA